MVERPIKKSERQASEAPDAASASSQIQSSTSEGSTALPDGIKPSSSPRPVKKGDAPRSTEKTSEKRERKNDRGKKSEKSDAPPVNPALMRGPKPPKASPKLEVEETPSEESEPSETAIESGES